MTVYSGPVFDMAVNQFGVIANHLSIPMDERDRLLLPKRPPRPRGRPYSPRGGRGPGSAAQARTGRFQWPECRTGPDCPHASGKGRCCF